MQSELTLEFLLAEINTLRQEVAGLQAQLAQATPAKPTVNPTRRKALKRFAALLLGGAAVSTFAAPPSLEAKIIANPTGQNGRIGAIIQPPGAALPTGSPAYEAKFGLLGSPDSAPDLNQLIGNTDAGVVGYTAAGGFGVYGVSGTGAAVYGLSSGYGVAGISNGSGYGVFASGNFNYGIFAISSTGAPLHLEPGNQPTYGSNALAQKGDIYVDSSGNLHIYNGSAWKQVATL